MDFTFSLRGRFIPKIEFTTIVATSFALVGCTDEPTAMSQHSQLAAQHQQQIKQVVAIEHKIQALYRFETAFAADFHLTPSHMNAWQTGVVLPKFLENVSHDHYLGALYHKQNKAQNQTFEQQPLNSYQLEQLLNHQDTVLTQAIKLDVQLAKQAVQTKNNVTDHSLDNYRSSLQKVISLHRQTMAHLMVSLMHNGLVAAEQAYDDIGDVANALIYSRKADEVWQQTIKPLAQKQWGMFDKKYLQQIKAVRAILIKHSDQNGELAPLFSHAHPHALLSYKYFWPETDLTAYLKQKVQRKSESDKLLKVIGDVKLEHFAIDE